VGITYTTIGGARPADVALSNDGRTIYASFDDGYVRAYDKSSGALLKEWHVGTDLGAIDLSPDGSFLAIVEDHILAGEIQSPWWDSHLSVTNYKLDLGSGTVTSFLYTTTSDEYSFYDIGVLSDNSLLLTQRIFPGWSGWVTPKHLDTTTGIYTSVGSTIPENSWLSVARDGSGAFIEEANISDAAVHVYRTASNQLFYHGLYADNVQGFNYGVQAYSGEAGLGVQGLGSHIYVYGNDAKLKIDLATLGYNYWPSAMAFDATGSHLWIFDSTSHSLVAFSTSAWNVVSTVALSGTFSVSAGYANGLTVLPGEHQFLLTTTDGMLLVTTAIDGTGGDDDLGGTADGDRINGGGGDDVLSGLGGDDVLNGEDGDDALLAGPGNDQLNGGAGDDNLRGGAGVDSYDGGADDGIGGFATGFADKVSFFDRTATQGAVADLRTNSISNDGFGNAETMTNIESLGSGTAFADTFYGNDGRNYLWGSAGDSLFGFGGDDILRADSAPAAMDGGAGVDELRLSADGGFLLPDSNSDGLAETAAAMAAGWTVNLFAGTVTDGYGNSGTVTGVENVLGSEFGDSFVGDSGDNLLDGAGGNDLFNLGWGGNDTVFGGAGNDYMFFADTFTAADRVDGGSGADTVALLGTTALVLDAGTLAGVEVLSLLSGTAAGGSSHVTYSLTMNDGNVAAGQVLNVFGGGLLSDETMLFNGLAESDGSFLVYGGAAADSLVGGQRNDSIIGGAGDDQLYGMGGNDWLEGGLGADLLRGGFGSDLFVYKSAAESTAAASDHIVDFEDQVDLINLQGVDANSGLAGDQAFSFIGQNAFSHTAGELRIEGSGSNWFVQGDTDGDGIADLVIQVDTFRGYALQATNFML
jgi:Ca2+-binding RTX toxin-like protein